VTVPSFGVVLKAMEQDKHVKVLSQPHLLTIDNTKASIAVGQSTFPSRPRASAPPSPAAPPSSARTSARTSRSSSSSRRTSTTPSRSASSSTAISPTSPTGRAGTQAGGPTTNKRTIKTTVVVDDGETIVLGGLEKDSESETVEKVPGLGDIPLIGRLFQYRGKARIKQKPHDRDHALRDPRPRRSPAESSSASSATSAMFDESYAEHSREYRPFIDYGRKRGLLEEINVAARRVEVEAAMLREASAGQRPADRGGRAPVSARARARPCHRR